MISAAGNGTEDATKLEDGTYLDQPSSGSIIVGATAIDGAIEPKSNFGEWVVVAAPGHEGHDLSIQEGHPAGYFRGIGGTSGAAAKVTGVVALMLAQNKDLKPACIAAILKASGKAVPSKKLDSRGRSIVAGSFLNAAVAIQKAGSPDACSPPVAALQR